MQRLTVTSDQIKLPAMDTETEKKPTQTSDENLKQPTQEVPPPKLRDLRAERDPMGAARGRSGPDRRRPA